MTVTTLAQAAPFGAITIFRVVSAFENAVETISTWHMARRTRVQLHSLSDDILSDIGLDRSELARF